MSGAARSPDGRGRPTRCAQCSGRIGRDDPFLALHGLAFHRSCAVYRRPGRGPRKLGRSPAGRPVAIGGRPLA